MPFCLGRCCRSSAAWSGISWCCAIRVFAVEALSHITFTGALGVAIAGGNPLLGLFGVTLLAAIGMGGLEMRSQARARDVAIGTLLAWVLGLGALFLSLYTTSANGAIGVNLLFGSIFGIQAQQANLTAVFSLSTIAALLAIARPLLFASVDPEVAVARGVPVRGLNFAFLALVALSVAVAVPAVGALLNSALIVTPAAIAQRPRGSSVCRALAVGAAGCKLHLGRASAGILRALSDWLCD